MVHLGRTYALLIVATGCRQIAGLPDPIDVGPGENACFTTLYETICLAQPPNAPQPLFGVISTSTPLCAGNVVSGAVGECVIAGTTITITAGAVATLTGPRPIVLIATDAITIDGTLDASSHGSNSQAAGANFAGCAMATSPGSGGGGAGGSFASRGGDGGAPNPSTAGTELGEPTSLHGGCSGRMAGGDSGSRGSGGGAVYLLSSVEIKVNATGVINASGSGGQGADGTNGGGGGGGSGGMIVLDAPSVTVAGNVFANGGGGGGGATTSQGQSGQNPMGADMGGMGGTGSGGAGSGGSGGCRSYGAGKGGDGSAGTAGGGGGGGSVGVIKVKGQSMVSGIVSPAPS